MPGLGGSDMIRALGCSMGMVPADITSTRHSRESGNPGLKMVSRVLCAITTYTLGLGPFVGTTEMEKPPSAALIIYCLLLPGVQQNRLHPFGGTNTR
jgi:hypothetical protein